jgi:hypothetical protein
MRRAMIQPPKNKRAPMVHSGMELPLGSHASTFPEHALSLLTLGLHVVGLFDHLLCEGFREAFG